MILDQLSQRLKGRADLSLLSSAEQVVMKRALAANPSDRFESCAEFVSSLTAVVSAVESGGRPPSSQSHSRSSLARRTPFPQGGSTIRTRVQQLNDANAAVPRLEDPGTSPVQDSEPNDKPLPAPFEFNESRVPFHLAASIAAVVFMLVAYFVVQFLRR
jgi:hypothetical protein